MATSGTYTYRTTRDQALNGALRLVNAIDPENVSGATTTQLSTATEALNLMLKQWEAIGIQIWERKWGVIFPQKGQATYALGSPGPAGDYACTLDSLDTGGFVKTTLSSAMSATSTSAVLTTLSSTSSAGITALTAASADYIGIVLDSGVTFWTTISGAPSGTTCTLTAGVTTAAASGNTVYVFRTKMVRPLRILDAFIRQVSGGNDSPVRLISKDEYNRYGYKASPGQPNSIYYNQQSNTGFVQVYPVFNTATNLLYIEYQSPIQDITASGDDWDLPQEWGNVIKFKLALYLAPEYDVPDSKFKQIQFLADEAFNLVEGWDQEQASLEVSPSVYAYPERL